MTVSDYYNSHRDRCPPWEPVPLVELKVCQKSEFQAIYEFITEHLPRRWLERPRPLHQRKDTFRRQCAPMSDTRNKRARNRRHSHSE
jgi:hypothetical protein